jgi:hypothetical protein
MTDYKRPSVFQQTLENGAAGFARRTYIKEEEISSLHRQFLRD